MSKELVREFRAAAWPSGEAVGAFVQRCAQLDLDHNQQMLAVLADRKAAAEGRPHQLRCVVYGKVVTAAPNRELFVPLVRAARTADPFLMRLLADLIPRVNNVGAHPELCALFRHQTPEVRALAKEVATRVGGKTIFQTLSEWIALPDFVGRIEAIDAMVAMAGHHAVPVLRTAVKHASREERLRIIAVLASPELVAKHRDAALDAVSALLHEADPEIVSASLHVLGSLVEETEYLRRCQPLLESQDPSRIIPVVRAARHVRGGAMIDMLREQLTLGPRNVRIAVLETVEAYQSDEGLPLIVEALNHRQLVVRQRAAEALKGLNASGKVDVARTVLWLLRSRDVDIKRLAADVAREVTDEDGRLWPKLLEFLRDEDWWVRERITDALVEMAGNRLTRHVANYLNDPSDVVRRFGVEMLMRIKDPASLGALVRAAQADADWWVRERAIEAMGELGDRRAVPYVLDFLAREEDLRLVCLATLAKIPDPSAAQFVAEMVDTDDPWLALECLKTLTAIGNTQVAPLIEPALTHFDHRVRSAAQELVRTWDLKARLGGQTRSGGLTPLDVLLTSMANQNADDLLLAPGRAPHIKKMGEVRPMTELPLGAGQIESMLLGMLTPQQRDQLDRGEDVDVSYEVRSEGLRFRCNIFASHTGLSGVFRVVRNVIPTLDALGLPPIVHSFGDLPHGLVLVGGPTGSGKSTTLAALVDYINRTYARHIITLEDPIEVVHTAQRSLVNQREIGTHSLSYSHALRATLREDPDVILVGEMRDLQTIQFAISAAETGHLVFGTVHTASADTAVDRLINAFPAGQQPQVRTILASSLRAVCCQYLAPRKDGNGRVPALEVLLNTPAVANLIRNEKAYQIPNLIAVSREQGMRSMDHELIRLYREGIISADTAYVRAMNKKEVEAVIAEAEGGRRVSAATGDAAAVQARAVATPAAPASAGSAARAPTGAPPAVNGAPTHGGPSASQFPGSSQFPGNGAMPSAAGDVSQLSHAASTPRAGFRLPDR